MAFNWYREVTIDHTKVPSDQTDFPVLISGTYAYLKTVGNGGEVTDANGYDVGFYADVYLTSKLKWEVERYVAATGEVLYWVKVPAVSASVDTVFYMAYGNSGISSDQSDPANVWDANFKGVFHLPDGTTLSVADSTGINSPTNHSATAGTGKIGGGGSFDGATKYVDLGATVDPTASLTVSAWVNPASLPGGSSYKMIAEKGYDGTNEQFAFGFANDVNTGNVSALSFYTFNGAVHGTFIATSGNISTGTLYFLCGVFNGSTWKIYINGVEVASTTDSQAPIHTAKPLLLGAATINASVDRFFDGILDELRISTAARSADWIAAEYNNQSSPSTFYALGSQTTPPTPPANTLAGARNLMLTGGPAMFGGGQ